MFSRIRIRGRLKEAEKLLIKGVSTYNDCGVKQCRLQRFCLWSYNRWTLECYFLDLTPKTFREKYLDVSFDRRWLIGIRLY